MISALDASKLVESSTIDVDEFMFLIDAAISNLAKAGKRTFTCYIAGLWQTYEADGSVYAEYTPIQLIVATKLRHFGYSVSLGKGGVEYVPRGLVGDNGDGIRHVNVCLIIKW